jgi:hypothetical protein
MKRIVFGFISLIFIGFISVVTYKAFANFYQIDGTEKKAKRYVNNEAYGLGEKLEYNVGYKMITAGTGYFHILPKAVDWNGRQCFDIRFQVRSLESLEWLYKVKDDYRTIVDIDGIFPWHFEQHIREGNYKRDFTATFDQDNNFAMTEVGGKKNKYKVEPYIHDIVSAFFYVRTLDLGSMRKDTVFYLKNFYKDTSYSLGVKILGKQTIEVPAGKFKCVVIEPLVVDGGLFKNEGRIMIWVTDDERKIPVKVGTKILIGFVGAELSKYSGTRGPIKAKIN